MHISNTSYFSPLSTDLERLNKSPEQDSNGVSLLEETDQPGSSEQTQEAETHEVT